jgi:hypothetical protein
MERIQLTATSNIANKVRNTRLPRTKPLMPLFEVISNSIHSIEELIKAGLIKKEDGKIIVECIRNGADDTLKQLKEIDQYPIHTFIVTDNGIGLNKENMVSFIEADTDHKIEIGGKGVGRFVCLKAFGELNIQSEYMDGLEKKAISFDFRPSKIGFENIEYPLPIGYHTGTKVKLNTIKTEYQKNLNSALHSIATEIVSHFKLYFIRKQVPKIIVRNQNNVEFDLANIFDTEFKSDVKQKEFTLEGESFTLFITKALNIQSHKINFCAHNRSVIREGLYSRIIDLGKKSITDSDGSSFYYQAYVVGNLLDENVDTERIGFEFPDGNEDEDEEESSELNLSKLRRASIKAIEELLEEYLTQVRQHKVELYKPTIDEELPQYRSTLLHRKEAVLKLPPDLSKDKLDIELYKIEAEWRLEVKQEKIQLLEGVNAIADHEEYKNRYEKLLTDFNEIGKSDLARYVVHRKTIIELLETLIEQMANGKFENENLIHTVFFPMQTNSDEITPDKQNLWLIDERLTYHSFLASDKSFKSIDGVTSESRERADLLIYNEAFAFSDSKMSPHNSFTIVEFKKPMRDDYKDFDDEKNPIEQTEKYIENLIEGKVKGRNGRFVEVGDKTPFYIYIVCDITPSLEKILKRREFDKTPDGKGYYKIKSKQYSAYFEVLPFEKVLTDAQKRNRILFEKLNVE